MIPQLDSAPAERTCRIALWVAALNMIALAAVAFGFSWVTYLLDEVKLTIFLIAGPLLMLGGLLALWRGHIPAPPRPVALGLTAYGAVLILSTLTSRFAWAGEHQLLLFWSAAGFFLTAFCAGASPRLSSVYGRFLTLLLLGVGVVGFMMFDPTHSRHSAVSLLFRRLYGGEQIPVVPFSSFLSTLSRAEDTLQSTVFNPSFYCGFCLMLAPFAMSQAVAPGAGRWRWLWRVVGYAALVPAVSAVIFSRPGWPALAVAAFAVALFLALLVRSGALTASRLSLLLFIANLGAMTLLVIGLQRWVFHYAAGSSEPFWSDRGVMWNAALALFKAHPVLGGGPGTLVIYFNNFRSPDYYLYGINNVTPFSHNIFMDVLCETGALGLIAFIFLLVALLAPALRRLPRHPSPALRVSLAAAATSLIVFLLYNCFDSVGRWIIGVAPLWSVMGFLGGLFVQSRPIAPDSIPAEESAPALVCSSPMVRMLALACLLSAMVILPLSAGYGLRNLRGERAYALGINYYEAATSLLSQGADKPGKLDSLIKHSISFFGTSNKGVTKRDQMDSFFLRTIDFFRASMTTNRLRVSANYKLASACCTLSQIEDNRMQEAKRKGDQAEAGRLEIAGARHLAESIKAYEELARLSPDYAEIHYNFGIVYHQAAELLRREPRFALAFDKSPEEYDKLAIEHLLRMTRQSSKSDVAILAGSQLVELGRYDEALKILRQGSDRHPDDSQLAQEYLKAAQKNGALVDVTKAQARLEALTKKK